jgi:hypothetical protein
MMAVEVAASWRLFVLRWFLELCMAWYTNDDGVYPLRAKKENNVTRKNRSAADRSNDQEVTACMHNPTNPVRSRKSPQPCNAQQHTPPKAANATTTSISPAR